MSNGQDDEHGTGNFASPPCFMHEIDPVYAGLTPAPDSQQKRDVNRWRKAERQRLLAARLAIPAADRHRHGAIIAAGLDDILGDVSGKMVGVYWPIRCEPDLRQWMAGVAARGGRCALPVVVKPHTPLVFRAWQDGDKLERGVWNIPVPATGAEVIPDIVISPVVGFDGACYRLGYGGGFYDRTLASLAEKPRIVGVGYAEATLLSIYPQPHDIPMDMIVTENGCMAPGP